MARVDVQTFEANSTTANVLGGDIFSGATIGTTHVRTGSRAMRISSLSSGTAQGYLKKWLSSTAGGPYFLRIGIYIVSTPSASNTIMQFNGASGSLGTTPRLFITLESNGTLILRNAGGTQIGSASSAINDSAYHIVELKHDGTGGTNLKTIEGRLDGVVFATSSVQNQGNPLAYSVGGNLASEAQTTGEWWVDDVALNDSTGSFQTGYPGVSNIVRALVNGAGDANGFLVQVGGTAGSANNYTRVNEVPPDDATSYNASAVLNSEDLFTIDVSGVPSTATINAVLVGERSANITAADTTTGIKLEMMKASGGTKAQSGNIVPNTTSWNTNGTSTPRNYQLVLYQDPDSATWNPATWTPQIGYIIDAVTLRAVGITNLWAEIDYTPAVAGTLNISVSDIITTSESQILQINSFINKSDTATTSENINQVLVDNISLSDTITTSENTKLLNENNVSTTDNITVSENIVVFIPFLTITVSDNLTTNESLSITSGNTVLNILISDTLTTSESINLEVNSFINKSDTLAVSESIISTLFSFILSSDTITMSESTKETLISFINKSDTITTSESQTIQLPFLVKSVFDSITTSENVIITAPAAGIGINSSEAITLSENIRLLVGINITLSDSIILSESISITAPSRIIPVTIIISSGNKSETIISGTKLEDVSSGVTMETVKSDNKDEEVTSGGTDITITSSKKDTTL